MIVLYFGLSPWSLILAETFAPVRALQRAQAWAKLVILRSRPHDADVILGCLHAINLLTLECWQIVTEYAVDEIPRQLFFSEPMEARQQDGGIECGMEVIGRGLHSSSGVIPFALDSSFLVHP